MEGRKSEKPVVLHSRHRKMSFWNILLAGLASYGYDKAENKCTDQSPEFILRLKDTYSKAAGFWMQTVLGKSTYLEQATLSSLAKMLINS